MTSSDLDRRPARRGIGVFDSGVGGLTVARALRRRLPDQPITYLGDTARLPYGTKSAATVARYTERNVRFLLERGVEVVVVACNSASALVVESDSVGAPAEARVLGVIGPGAAQAALVARERVGVVATEATVGSNAYPRALEALRPELEVMSVACPLLVPLVEENWLDDVVTFEVVRRYTEPLRRQEVDTLILGCTHYPLLRDVFAEVMGDGVRLVDSAEAVSARVAGLFESLATHEGGAITSEERATASDERAPLEAFVTDSSPRFARIAEAVLGEPVRLEWIDTP